MISPDFSDDNELGLLRAIQIVLDYSTTQAEGWKKNLSDPETKGAMNAVSSILEGLMKEAFRGPPL